ncbi:MAG: two-component system response regulator, partial [Candidatus Sedimenticola sp. (ex Thyasira tokunagai)]
MSEENRKPTVLVVDDTPENIDVLRGVLKDDYKIKAAVSGERALKIAHGENKPDIILLDIMMPIMDGYEVCEHLKSDITTQQIPVIFITAKNDTESERRGLKLGAVDFLSKPISPPIVKARVHTHLALYDQSRALEDRVRERTVELDASRLQIIRRLCRAAEYKDNETGLHVIRMSHYARLIAEGLDLPAETVNTIYSAAPMHDVGKIGIPDKILLKPGKLDSDEWEIMMQHTSYGAEIIGNHDSALLTMSRTIALCHHEKWNGKGYPNGLAGEDIPLEARIVAIADVFDALTSERPYKKAWPVEKAIAVIQEDAGSHFDPNLVPIFIEKLPQVLE